MVTNSVKINGVTYTFREDQALVVILGTKSHEVKLEGQTIHSRESGEQEPLRVEAHGELLNLFSTADVHVNGNVSGKVDANGNVRVEGSVGGGVDTNGDVSCTVCTGDINTNGNVVVNGDYKGDVETTGDVRVIGSHTGDIDTTGDVYVGSRKR
jgi:hypothetical protein